MGKMNHMRYNFYLDVRSGVIDISSVLSPDKRCAYQKDKYIFVGAFAKYTKRHSHFLDDITVNVFMGKRPQSIQRFLLTDEQYKQRNAYQLTAQDRKLIEKGKNVKFFCMIYLDVYTGKIVNKHTAKIKRNEYHTRYIGIGNERNWSDYITKYNEQTNTWSVINPNYTVHCQEVLRYPLTFAQLITKTGFQQSKD